MERNTKIKVIMDEKDCAPLYFLDYCFMGCKYVIAKASPSKLLLYCPNASTTHSWIPIDGVILQILIVQHTLFVLQPR